MIADLVIVLLFYLTLSQLCPDKLQSIKNVGVPAAVAPCGFLPASNEVKGLASVHPGRPSGQWDHHIIVQINNVHKLWRLSTAEKSGWSVRSWTCPGWIRPPAPGVTWRLHTRSSDVSTSACFRCSVRIKWLVYWTLGGSISALEQEAISLVYVSSPVLLLTQIWGGSSVM